MKKRITKEEMIDYLVTELVNPNWRGPKSSDERASWKKELRKQKWAELKAQYDEVREVRWCADQER